MAIKVLIPLASGGEELEVVTMSNLFRRAGFTVVCAGLAGELTPVKCARGTMLVPDATLAQALSGDYDLVALPGGQPGTDNLRKDKRIGDLVRRQVDSGRWLAAICAAPMVLGEAGVLAGRRATSFPGCLEPLKLPDVEFVEQAVVVDGKVVTSKGPGTAMDFTLTLIELMAGVETRRKVEGGLQRC
ncbi:MAG: DJ-1/PfpI family protein [Desulfobulbaceae bacterium]|nr:DJ-1/PfpI family protein [Desulfobulbaceae bacterium]